MIENKSAAIMAEITKAVIGKISPVWEKPPWHWLFPEF